MISRKKRAINARVSTSLKRIAADDDEEEEEEREEREGQFAFLFSSPTITFLFFERLILIDDRRRHISTEKTKFLALFLSALASSCKLYFLFLIFFSFSFLYLSRSIVLALPKHRSIKAIESLNN